MNSWQKVSLLVATVALVGGALFVGTAYAQTPAPTATPSAEQSQTPERQPRGWFGGLFGRFFGDNDVPGRGHMGRPGMGHGRGDRMAFPGGPMAGPLFADRQAILAEALGMSVQDLQKALDEGKTVLAIAEAKGLSESQFYEALRATATKHIDQAVKDGKLTQAQADRLKDRIENGPLMQGLGMGGLGRGIMESIIGNPGDLLAEATGKTPQELQTALKATIEKRVAAAVKDGKITQAQADEILSHVDNGLPFFGLNKGQSTDDAQQ